MKLFFKFICLINIALILKEEILLKKLILLLMILLLTVAAILTGCSPKKDSQNKESNSSQQLEQKTTEDENTKEINPTTPKDTMLPKDLSTIMGIDYKEVQKQKGSGEEEYMDETLIGLTYNEKWFGWDEKVQATYGLGDDAKKNQITSISFEFSEGTDDTKLIEQISKYLGDGKKHEGGETSNYYIEWEQNGVQYYLEDYGYLVMSIQKTQ